MDRPAAWSNFALFKGSVLAQKADDNLNPQFMKFEYKQTSSDTLQEIAIVLRYNIEDLKIKIAIKDFQ